jgi:hypothetical protein
VRLQSRVGTVLEYNHSRLCHEERSAIAVCLLPGTEISFQDEVRRGLTGFQLFLASEEGCSVTPLRAFGKSIWIIPVRTMTHLIPRRGDRSPNPLAARTACDRATSSRVGGASKVEVTVALMATEAGV